MRFIDLSHPITDGMITYPGLPGPVITEYLGFDASVGRYADGVEFTIGRIELVANTGTYLDTPGHRWRDGHDLSALPLERCALLPAVTVDVAERCAGADLLRVIEPDILAGAAVLLRTGWDEHWGTDQYADPEHPYLDADGAQLLVERDVALVGIDSVNIDDMADGTRPAHSQLLRAGIPVVEHLTGLAGVPSRGALFSAVPAPVRGLSTFPVRAFAAVG